MTGKFKQRVSVLIIVTFIFQLSGCGTILYPERKGQKSGRIDPAIAILDGIGLLFFLVPGVIAFAIDFNNGSIYLPGTSRSSLDGENIRQVAFDPEHSSRESIEKIIREETGCDVRLDQRDIWVSQLQSTDDMMAHFERFFPELKDSRS